MFPKLGLQLYTVRDRIQADGYETIIRQVARLGYAGVETAGFPGTTAEKAAKLFQELGLTVLAAHSQFPVGDKKQEVLEMMAALGNPYLVCTNIGPDNVKDMDAIKAHVERVNEAQAVAAKAGLKMVLHNHWWEFHLIDGRPAQEIVAEMVDPAVLFELDTYWIKVGGVDPAAAVAWFGKRSPLLHIKDGSGVREDPQTAAGKGMMDFPAILKAGGTNTEWWIYEADRVAGDAVEASAESCDYLKSVLK